MAVTTLAEIQQRIAQGKGIFIPAFTTTPGAATAAAAASGQFSAQILLNAIGSTMPATRVGFPTKNTPGSPLMVVEAGFSRNTANTYYLAYFYRVGSVNLAATGDQFTHHSATFPILRTEFGESSKALSLIPFVYIDDAGTVTAPVFSMKTNAGGVGYVNQDGSNVVAARTMTMPSATAAVQSGYIMRLNDGDSGIQDVIQVDVDTASGSAATCIIFGVEVLADITGYYASHMQFSDLIKNGLGWGDMKPGVATSGTADAVLGVFCVGSTGATVGAAAIVGVLDS